MQSSFNFLSSRKWGALGDSITNRSSAAAARGWVDQLPKLAGGACLSSANYVEAGNPGETAANMLARYETDIKAAGVKTLFMLSGTNDIQAGRTLAQWSADVRAVAAKAKRDGIPLIVGTVPPRGPTAASSTTRELTAQYNLWLRTWAPTAGVYVAPVHEYLVTNAGNDMLSGYDSGDGIHPETLGHQKIAEAFYAAWLNVPKTPLPHLVTPAIDPYNLVVNPTAAGTLGAGRPTGWYEQPGGTGTEPTYTVAAATGNVVYGQVCTMAFDATASGGTRYLVMPMAASGWSTGDVLLISAMLSFVDNVGSDNFYNAARTASPTANVSLRVVANGFTLLNAPITNTPLTPGPVMASYTVPASFSSPLLALHMLLPTGSNVTATIGEVGVWNATTLGISTTSI
jgi:lysophospholipase L1-like esterase